MPRDYLITSARTRTLQAGVLVAFVVILAAILVQSVVEQRGKGALAGSTAAPAAARSMESAPRQDAHLLTGSAEKCAGDYVCDEDGAWETIYPTRSPAIRAQAEVDPTTLGRKAAERMGDTARASWIGELPRVDF